MPPDVVRPLAIVTGPTAGIGRLFAERLARSGHDLLLVSRDAERLQRLASELGARYGVTAVAHPADLADDAQAAALASELAALPRVDVLVNNAGFGTLGSLVRTDPERQAAMVRLHCIAPLRLAQAVLPRMTQRRAGLIVNVSSVAAFVTGAANGTYAATKAFVRTLSDGIAADVAGTGVRVQALCPGFTRTEFHDRMGYAPSRIPAFLWLTTDEVVDASLRAAARGGPVTVIPSVRYRLLVALLRHLPLRVLSAVGRRGPRGRV